METAFCDALKTAFEFEKGGEKLYRSQLDRVTNEFARKVLTFLADEEAEHMRKLEAFNDALLGNGEFDVEEACSAGVSTRVKQLVQNRTDDEKERFAPDSTDLDVYEIAMDMEKKSYVVYEQALADSKSLNNAKLDRFFAFLLEEEKEHYDLLAASKKYLEDPAYYFLDYGGWVFS